ncbi:MAG: hypothetical protein ACT4N2_13770 [Hyphomicrobium sp.]
MVNGRSRTLGDVREAYQVARRKKLPWRAHPYWALASLGFAAAIIWAGMKFHWNGAGLYIGVLVMFYLMAGVWVLLYELVEGAIDAFIAIVRRRFGKRKF